MKSKAASGFDLCEVIKQTMAAHSKRNGCVWIDGAYDMLVGSSEFDALAAKLESLEICAH